MKTYLKTKITSVHFSFQDFFLIISKCRLSIVMLIAGIYMFILNSQGRDIVTSYSIHNHWGMLAKISFCMLFWGIESWFGARIALHLSDLTTLNNDKQSKLPTVIPRILGFLSMSVFFISFLCFNEDGLLIDRIVLVLPFIIYWFVIVKRRIMIQRWNNSTLAHKNNFQIEINEISNRAIKYGEITKSGKLFFYLPLVMFPILVLLITVFPISFPTWCTPTVVILLGIAVWTGIATAFMVYEKRLKIPLILVAAVTIYLFSFINNNHAVRIGAQITIPDSFAIGKVANKWIEQLPLNSSGEKTIFIACGQGGGIRAAYWTAAVLASLTDSDQTFPKHLFALSTVSGSSLGAVAFNSFLKFYYPKDTLTKQVEKFMKEDYLSPVAAAFFFPDAFQRFFPRPITSFDRARYLEKSWEDGWAKNSSSSTNPFSDDMHKLWNNNKMLPNLFLNSTHSENGRKVIVSNLLWNEDQWKSRNVNRWIGYDMPLSSSALLSARFPILTPGAKISDLHTKDSTKYLGTLVDGGYYDNYGVVTATDIYNDIRANIVNPNLKIVILMILNGDSIRSNPEPIKYAYELRTVPTAFLNAYEAKPEKALDNLDNIISTNKDLIITIALKRDKNENLPLGWCLSDKAIGIMNRQLQNDDWYKQKKQIISLIH